MTKKNKHKLIEQTIKATNSDGAKVLDQLSEYSEQYLNKLLKVISIL